ncbi:Dimethyladenosine transferase 1, mitochondrial [Mortierella sp. GBA43]|nr:Dimethyladenosine transferase 1, mitochondrial [Mortierella sp. GBA43]
MAATRLPSLPPIRDLIRIYGLSASQRFSQNFILDKNVTDTIAKRAKVSLMDDLVVEVGPGPGLLTRSILDAGAQRVIAIEKDPRFMPALEASLQDGRDHSTGKNRSMQEKSGTNQLSEAADYRLGIINGDMLKLDHHQILEAARELTPSIGSAGNVDDLDSSSRIPFDPSNATIRLVGNLPFGVASPLLIQWLKMMALRQGIFRAQNNVSMTLMFQEEVAKGIVAPPKDPERGRLSVMAQALCDVKLAYKLSAATFVPKPRVNAAVVHFERRAEPLVPGSLDKLEDVVRFYFNKRRKTIGHNTNRIVKAVPEALDVVSQWTLENSVDLNMRAQDVSTEQFCALARLLDQEKLNIPMT